MKTIYVGRRSPGNYGVHPTQIEGVYESGCCCPEEHGDFVRDDSFYCSREPLTNTGVYITKGCNAYCLMYECIKSCDKEKAQELVFRLVMEHCDRKEFESFLKRKEKSSYLAGYDGCKNRIIELLD